MSTCLTTRLDGVVSGSNLRTPSEFRIKTAKQSTYIKNRSQFIIHSLSSQTLKIINETEGNNYFYNENDTNLGKTVTIQADVDIKLYCSNGSYEISIPNKYALRTLNFGRFTVDQYKFFSYDIDELKYVTSLYGLISSGNAVTGDIKTFAYNTGLQDFTADRSNIYGDIGSLKTLTNLRYFRFNYCNDVYGDITVARYMPNLKSFEVSACSNIYGDISAFTNCSDIEWVNFPSNVGQGTITGNISAFANKPKLGGFVCEDEQSVVGDIAVFKTSAECLKTLHLWRCSISGDIAELAPCNAIINIRIGETDVSGDLGVFLADKPNLSYIDAQWSGISGDITGISVPAATGIWLNATGVTGSIGKVAFEGLTVDNEVVLPAHNASDGFIKHCPAMLGFDCNNTQLEGDIDVFAGCSAITNIQVYNSNVSGNIESLANLSALQYINIGNTTVHGDIGVGLGGSDELLEIWAENTPLISGDLSTLGAKVYLVLTTPNAGPFTWTTTRPSTSSIIAMRDVNLGEYLDAMFINQANCQPSSNGSFGDTTIINVHGTHSSDASVRANARTAIQTLMGKGYVIYINGVIQTESTISNI